MTASPQADGFGDRQERAAVLGEGVHNRRGNASGSLLIDDAVGLQFAQLLGQHFCRNPRHEAMQRQKLSRRFREPVDDDQLPLPAHRRQRRSERTIVHRVGSPRATGSYLEVPSGRQDVLFATMPGASPPVAGIRDRQSCYDSSSIMRRGPSAAAVPAARAAGSASCADTRSGNAGAERRSARFRFRGRRLEGPAVTTRAAVERLHDVAGLRRQSVVRKVWDGRANLGELEVEGSAGHIEGLTLRLYNAQSRQWNITWANAREGALDRATMYGGFKDGRGEFFGQDSFDGRAIYVRFEFSSITPTSFRFDQAFSADGGRTWEVNWRATFTR